MIVGFTGTQNGMTALQKVKVKYLLIDLKATVLHHGDCVGADTDAHSIAKELNIKIHLHPPINPSKRSFCKADNSEQEKEYLERNHDIVDCSDVLIAIPKGFQEELRSGTWATIRYAKKTGKEVYIILPNGELK